MCALSELRMVPVDEVLPNPEQPREEFDAAEIESLAESIREQGQIQPIVVVESQEGYTLVDGERRLRATKLLGRATIRAEVREYNEPAVDKFIQALAANLQRADLNPIEEGKAFKKLHKQGKTLRTIASMAGKSITHVNFRLKLLDFEPEIQELFAARKLPLDPATVYSLASLPEGIRARMAARYAARGTGCTGIKASVSRILRTEQDEAADVPLVGRKRAPASILSDAPDGESRIMKLAGESGSMPQWELINKAAAETCESCDLNDMASAAMCKDCPAVELLRRLGSAGSGGEG